MDHEMSDPPLPQESKFRKIEFDSKTKSWKLLEEAGLTVVAAALKHRIPSFGFIIKEKNSPGRLNCEKLSGMGILPGPIYGKLKARHKVTLDSGDVLDPGDYLGPDVPGRRLAILGDTCDSLEIVAAAAPDNLDVLGNNIIVVINES